MTKNVTSEILMAERRRPSMSNEAYLNRDNHLIAKEGIVASSRSRWK